MNIYRRFFINQIKNPSLSFSLPKRTFCLNSNQFEILKINNQQHIHVNRKFHTNLKLLGVLQFKLADIGEGIAEVNVKEWFVKVGDKVKQFDRICEVQSDKATVTITSRYDGTIKKLYYDIEDTAFVGKPLVDIETDDVESTPEPVHIENSVEQAPDKSNQEFKINKVLATPSVRKMALDNKVNIAEIQGSGKDGRILKDDIIRYLKEQSAAKGNTLTSTPEPQISTPLSPPKPQEIKEKQTTTLTYKQEKLVADKKEQIKGIRKSMAKVMAQANNIPHFSYCDEYDMSSLVNLRIELKSIAKKYNIGLSYLPFIIKACSISLNSYPVLNSHVDANCDFITYKASHNIGVAIDTRDGLIVPNIKNVQEKTIFEIAIELNNLQFLGENSKLSPNELSGGTFTLSNIGTIGGTYMKPILMPPEVAIGALGKIQLLPRYDDNGQLVARNLMQVSWSADHRVIDGATMARFSNKVKNYLQNPSLMLLDLK